MAHIKINYGIDLGTTNSAVCRMESGELVIKKSDTLKDTLPSCVSFTRNKSIRVGDFAFNIYKSEKRNATKRWQEAAVNTFIEFKRTMGLDTPYQSTHMECSYSSEELSAEILKTLKSFVTDDTFHSVVITVPAKFTINQKDATMRAARLAGFEHSELLQEPIAASIAYGVNSGEQHGYWMVFDFGGGTFDAALLRVEDGIMQVFDTEGDNYLGGKNLDYAIADEILIPYLKEHYAIESILADKQKKEILREAMKTYAEEVKNQLPFKPQEDIISNLGELGEDDEGNELELDLTVTQEQLERVLAPIFQKSIDICKELLQRNNMQGNQLSSLILVGGPTYSPVVRKMLREQVTPQVNTSIDPMTAVARGAALYASTLESEVEEVLEQGTVALEIRYEATSVQQEEFVSLKLLREKSTGNIPEKLYAEITRGDKAWSSGRVALEELGDVIECQLVSARPNLFTITVYDDKGNVCPSFPSEITIIQGSRVGNAVLPYSIGIEVYDAEKEKTVFTSVKGLERNQLLPAKGIIKGLRTTNDLRPGISTDFIQIPIYQGDEGAEGVRAIYYEHVYTAQITGDHIPAFLPAGSEVDITLKSNRSEGLSMEVFFPLLGHLEEIEIDKDTVQKEVTEDYLQAQISQARSELKKLQEEGVDTSGLQQALQQVQNELGHGDQKKQVLQHLKETQRKIDKIDSESEWSRLERELQRMFDELQGDQEKYGNAETAPMVQQFRESMQKVIVARDIPVAKDLLRQMRELDVQLALIEYLVSCIVRYYREFDTYHWRNPMRARQLVNQGVQGINDSQSADQLLPLVLELFELLPPDEIPEGAEGILKR